MKQGFGIIDRDVMRNRNLSIKAKAVYAYLCSLAGNSGTCYPSRKTACYYLRITNDTLGRLLRELESEGAIKTLRKRNTDGTFQRNNYTINAIVAMHGNDGHGQTVSRISATDSKDTIINNK